MYSNHITFIFENEYMSYFLVDNNTDFKETKYNKFLSLFFVKDFIRRNNCTIIDDEYFVVCNFEYLSILAIKSIDESKRENKTRFSCVYIFGDQTHRFEKKYYSKIYDDSKTVSYYYSEYLKYCTGFYNYLFLNGGSNNSYVYATCDIDLSLTIDYNTQYNYEYVSLRYKTISAIETLYYMGSSLSTVLSLNKYWNSNEILTYSILARFVKWFNEDIRESYDQVIFCFMKFQSSYKIEKLNEILEIKKLILTQNNLDLKQYTCPNDFTRIINHSNIQQEEELDFLLPLSLVNSCEYSVIFTTRLLSKNNFVKCIKSSISKSDNQLNIQFLIESKFNRILRKIKDLIKYVYNKYFKTLKNYDLNIYCMHCFFHIVPFGIEENENDYLIDDFNDRTDQCLIPNEYKNFFHDKERLTFNEILKILLENIKTEIKKILLEYEKH